MFEYVQTYKVKNNLDEEEGKLLTCFLKDSLDRKRFQRVKDVDYDKTTGIIKDIPALAYTKNTKHFTLKNTDKRISTLKSLCVKKGQGTIRNKIVSTKNETDSENENDEK